MDRLTTLIYALLDTTRMIEGKLQLQKTEFYLDELITDTAETMQRIAGTQHIELALSAKTIIHADQDRIRQVLINLIGNAIKYSPGTDRIIVQSAIGDGQVTVCVQDFGIGIDDGAQKQVFERFFRGSENIAFSGLGLGLFIGAGIVRQHGGTISVKSKKGEGALFCFTIPIGIV